MASAAREADIEAAVKVAVDVAVKAAVKASEEEFRSRSSKLESAMISLLEQNINDAKGRLSDMELVEEYEGISAALQGM